MLYREIIKELENWKSRKHHPLLVCGLRQVGKTYIVKKFAEENYKNVVYIDLRSNRSIHKVFDGDFNVDMMITSISANIKGIKIEPYNTIIIFDEIQDCPNARSSFKYWDIDGRFDVIGTGSFLGVKGFRKPYIRGIPVGYEEKITMYPLTFKEFLLNLGIDNNVLNYINESLINKTKIEDTIHESMMSIYKQYLIVGGMPEAINTFFETHNINDVRQVQQRIIDSIKDDFGRYIDSHGNEKINESIKIKSEACLESLPAQLSKVYKKFQYSLVDIKGNSTEKSEGIEYLCDLGLAIKANNLKEISCPLNGQKKANEFKVYYADIGLLISQLDADTPSRLLDGDFSSYKGAITENIVASQLYSYGYNLYYYRASSGSPELDFVISYKNETKIIEVKSTNNCATSMNYVLNNQKKYGKQKGIKIANANIGVSNNYITIPLYSIGFINSERYDLLIKPITIDKNLIQ